MKVVLWEVASGSWDLCSHLQFDDVAFTGNYLREASDFNHVPTLKNLGYAETIEDVGRGTVIRKSHNLSIFVLPNAPTNMIRQVIAAGIPLLPQDSPSERNTVQAALLDGKLHCAFSALRN